MFLEIRNLSVGVKSDKDEKIIIDNLSLNLEKGKVYVLMGPNGSGKSTLANAIMGSPKYKIEKGRILFKGKDITKLGADKRAKLGMFLSFQYPQEVSGVLMSKFLREAYNSIHEKNKLSIFEFKKLLKEKMNFLGIHESFSSRYLNEGFSGGEKKKSEMLQLLTLNPDFAILDETDSGLDIDSLKLVAKGINEFVKEGGKEKTIFIITHYKRPLGYLKVDKVFIMKNGKIIQEGNSSLIDKLEEEGYSNIY